MGSFDSAEFCKLIGLFILNTLKQRFDNIGLYRDDAAWLFKQRQECYPTKPGNN